MLSQQGSELPSEYNTLNIGIALYDPSEGAILDANDRLETILGYPTERLCNLAIETYTANTYPHSESDFRARLQASASGNPQQFIWRVKRADGELIWVQIDLSRKRLSGQTCVYAEIRNITDYYETHHRVELFWRLLRHNLRNEASIIVGNASQLTAHTESESVQDAAATIQARGENLGDMASSVKEIEQAVAGTETQRVRRHATAAVGDVVTDVQMDYPAAKITLEERAEMGIHVDDAFAYALRHALENAIVHSDETEPVVDVSLGPSPNTGRVEICIADTNPPIPDEEFDALFTPTETTNTSHGSGTGLFVMKWCIESLNGEIKFETGDAHGNDVYFYLPPKTLPDEQTER
ncbi:PAS domain-containing sensor histidine kinase [Halorientalis marina]|jgi:PAS domain S-box-containing protein|uniref:PAS domain-containing sensor histidine kinase n=1 Tax=Halorientalis marina TaxID=2931976 RepID=UPI001FF6C505|nr:PAS domain-containing sensor histidine kinase [Halorientalis marina]